MFTTKPYHHSPSSPEFKAFYTGKEPIGIYAFDFGSQIKLMDVIFGITDRVIVQLDDGPFKVYKINYNKSGSMYFRMNGRRYRLDHFLSIN